jgi:NAD-dependent deacetylase
MGSSSLRTRRIVVLTGAGVSADSGLAVFRGPSGLWEGHRVEDVATPQAWRRNPALVWRFYQQRRAGIREAAPNAAHVALARLELELAVAGGEASLFTQNVDDLHERAGSTARHLHGELARLRCEVCGAAVRDLERLDPERFVPCNGCGSAAMRPDVVWFGELVHRLDELEAAVRRCTHFVAAGTSGAVWPAAGFLGIARSLGARTLVASLERPDNLHPDDEFLPGRAAETVPRMVERLLGGAY